MSVSAGTKTAHSPVGVTPTLRPRPKGIRSSKGHQTVIGALMVAPAVILLVLFFFVPVILSFTLAFTNARLVSPRPSHFVGLANFTTLLADSDFWSALRNVIYFAVIVVPVQAALGLVLAILINTKVRGTNIFRTVYFLPVVTSIVVVSLLWKFIYAQDGLLNALISDVTFGHMHGTDWLNNPATAMPAIIFMSIWQAVGFHMIIWLSGLQTIPGELYEAAALDGASPWQRFRYVTWPGLIATRTFILVTITISALSLFSQISVMTQGGPLNHTITVVFLAVRAGYQEQQTGYAAAISLLFFILVLAVSGVQRFLTREKA